MNRKTTIWLVVVMVAIGVILGIFSSAIHTGPVQRDRQPTPPPSDFAVTAKLIISFVTMFLVISLLVIYLDIYLTVRSKFTIGLIVTISALLVFAVTSNPVFQTLLGYPVAGAGIFLFIPDIFTAVAAAVLIYLSIE
jgi:hypothetical protein